MSSEVYTTTAVLALTCIRRENREIKSAFHTYKNEKFYKNYRTTKLYVQIRKKTHITLPIFNCIEHINYCPFKELYINKNKYILIQTKYCPIFRKTSIMYKPIVYIHNFTLKMNIT